MNKKYYLRPEIKIRAVKMDCLLSGSITSVDSGDDGPGYGGGGTGPAQAPSWGDVWSDEADESHYSVWED